MGADSHSHFPRQVDCILKNILSFQTQSSFSQVSLQFFSEWINLKQQVVLSVVMITNV